jgi:PAS domain S-box-containing protein
MAQMHGYTLEEMQNLKLQDLDTPETTGLAPERVRRLMAGEALAIELEHRHKDGHTFSLEVSASLIVSGDRPLVLAFNRDITERKRAEDTARLLEHERHQTQKMDSLGSLAGGVAHDFNNMLGGIMGYADLLLGSEQDPTRQKYLRSILSAASRSSELTQKLLAFGRRGKNRAESLDLASMVEECLAMLRPSMSPDTQVVVDMAGCPPVDGDPSQIHQVLVNLCINAIEAMPERGTLTIRGCARELAGESLPGPALEPGRYVELAVSDTGVGMTEETRQRIFEPFFTTKNSSRMSGTGLGLSTAYGIIQAHRGGISVHSIRGKGSTFRVLLPLGTAAPMPKRAPGESTPGQGLVLLVEDEPLLRDLGASVLETLGYEVVTAADGVEAIQVYRETAPRLRAVLLDLKMPNMGGREAFLAFRTIDPSVPVLICTGYGENEEVQDLLTLGAMGMLAKPYRVSELALKLAQVPGR